MSWEDIMRRVLPPVGGVSPHITSAFGATNRPAGSTNPHRAVDFNYDVGPGGQRGINLTHPALRSPVDGIVTNAGEGRYGTISIRDANGFSHEILHTDARHVSVGDPVVAGQLIGTMGNTGTKDQHVHYQLRDAVGSIIDPADFWDRQGPADPSPSPPAYLGEYQQFLQSHSPDAAGEFGNAPGAAIMPPARSSLSEQSTPASAGETAQLLGRRVAGKSGSSFFDRGTPAVPIVPPNDVLSPDRPNSFDTRFGHWTSSRAGFAPSVANQPMPPSQANNLLGIVSGQPMPNYPVPPPIWGPLDDSRATGDDRSWYARWRQLMSPE